MPAVGQPAYLVKVIVQGDQKQPWTCPRASLESPYFALVPNRNRFRQPKQLLLLVSPSGQAGPVSTTYSSAQPRALQFWASVHVTVLQKHRQEADNTKQHRRVRVWGRLTVQLRGKRHRRVSGRQTRVCLSQGNLWLAVPPTVAPCLSTIQIFLWHSLFLHTINYCSNALCQ